MSDVSVKKRILWVALFIVAMAIVESAIVVYLRRLYYPDGFGFPLKPIDVSTYAIELAREAATVVMLCAVGVLAGRRFWERFAYFSVAFGIWDIFYYIWLKIFINWPASLFDWDILFLLPLPWIGPVIAPCSIAVIMIVVGFAIIRLTYRGVDFHPTRLTWILVLTGTAILLYSFMHDLNATIRFQMPQPYRYELLIIGDILYVLAYLHSHFRLRKSY